MNSMNATYDPSFWLTISVMLTIFIYASKLVWKSIQAYSPDSIVSQTENSIEYKSYMTDTVTDMTDTVTEPLNAVETKPETDEKSTRKRKKSTPKN